jgi:hypothetical protein
VVSVEEGECDIAALGAFGRRGGRVMAASMRSECPNCGKYTTDRVSGIVDGPSVVVCATCKCVKRKVSEDRGMNEKSRVEELGELFSTLVSRCEQAQQASDACEFARAAVAVSAEIRKIQR